MTTTKKLICNYILFVFVFLFVFTATFEVLKAKDTSLSSVSNQKFEVTGGITKDFESTFDAQRTITGVAESGSEITICVSLKGENDIFFERANYIINVGAANLFSKTIELYVGENQISIYVEDGKTETIVQQFIVKRKNSGIKQLLEQNIVMPGDLFTMPRTDFSSIN